jgi:glucose/arabinose dehydrogenase
MPLRRSPALLIVVLLAVALAACGSSDVEPAAGPDARPTTSSPPAPLSPSPATPGTGLDVSSPQVLVTGLEVPWGLAFLPGGDALVSERDNARILRIPRDGGQPEEVMRLPQTVPGGEGGLLGLAVSRTYEQDGLVYAYLTAADDNRIVRFRLRGEVEPVLTGIPKSRVHNGGRIAFGPDGHLYVGTGDAGEPSRAQDDDSLGGKVLRMTPEGEPVGPSLVFSKGHRNVQGLAFDDDDRLYTVEFGQNRFDEINQVERGDNGGWPEVEGKGTGGGRFLSPIVTWDPAEASPSGAGLVDGSLYVAALRGQRLWQVPLDGTGGAGEPRALLTSDYGRLRTAARAPDGSLWVLTSNRDGRGDAVPSDDRILRLPPS